MNLIVLFLLLLLSSPAWATTYYVRDGGADYGTDSTHCNGTANVVYSGGNGPNCAVDHPTWILGTVGANGQDKTGHLSGGDTLYIDGDSDLYSGNAATYNIGYGMPNTTNGTCNTSFEYQCMMANIPAGLSIGSPTSIIGTGTHRPILLSTSGNPHITLDAENDYITLHWLEINGHGGQGYIGIQNSGHNPNYTDVYIHGFYKYGITEADATTDMYDATYTRLWIIGNGSGGFPTGTGMQITGTWTFNQPIIEWNGCFETYPLTVNSIDSPTNYTRCIGQNDGGYGDGLAFGNDAFGNTGNWTIIGPGSISFNVQDGLDTLHGTGNGIMQIDKMKFEGNGGNQVKLNAITGTVTNSVVIGTCGWWYGSTQAAPNHMLPGDSCRALGNTFSYFTSAGAGNTYSFYNNTVIGVGNVIFLQNGSCDSGTTLNIKNNIVNGGYDWNDDTTWNASGGNGLTAYIFASGTNGDGANCTAQTVVEDYNIVNNTKGNNYGCVGAHDKCGTASGFAAGTFLTGTAGGAANTFYQGQSATTSLVSLGGGSAAIGSGVAGLSYWNNSNDYYNNVFANQIGALASTTSLATNGFAPCFFNSDCSSNYCSNNVCSNIPNPSQNTYKGSLRISGVTFK